MVDCKICGHPLCSYAGVQRGIVVECANYMPKKKPQTNADRIRAMSDEELAEFITVAKERCDYCQLAYTEGACTETLCEDAMLKWLKQPVKDGEDDG